MASLLEEEMNNCIPMAMVPQVVRSAMKAAGLAPEVQDKVLDEMGGNKYITGTVILVTTNEKGSSVTISSGPPTFESLTIAFPPNPDEMLAELKRAQNEDRSVSAIANLAGSTASLISVMVYAGDADPASNKRR
jgi:hypothetical protein